MPPPSMTMMFPGIVFLIYLFFTHHASLVSASESSSSSFELPTDDHGDYDGSDIIAVSCEFVLNNDIIIFYVCMHSRFDTSLPPPWTKIIVSSSPSRVMSMSHSYTDSYSGSDLIPTESFIRHCALDEKFPVITTPCLDYLSSPTILMPNLSRRVK